MNHFFSVWFQMTVGSAAPSYTKSRKSGLEAILPNNKGSELNTRIAIVKTVSVRKVRLSEVMTNHGHNRGERQDLWRVGRLSREVLECGGPPPLCAASAVQ